MASSGQTLFIPGLKIYADVQKNSVSRAEADIDMKQIAHSPGTSIENTLVNCGAF